MPVEKGNKYYQGKVKIEEPRAPTYNYKFLFLRIATNFLLKMDAVHQLHNEIVLWRT